MNRMDQVELTTTMDRRLMNPLRAFVLLYITVLCSILVESSSTIRNNEHLMKHDFIRQMKSIEEQHNIDTSKGMPLSLQQRLISVAQRIPRKETTSTGSASADVSSDRRLNSYYNVYYNAKNKYINSYFNNDDIASSSSSSAYDEVASEGYSYNGYNADKDSFYDDYYAFLDDDQYVEKGNQYRKAESYDIDLTRMAMKYVGCQNVHSWQNGGGVTNRFVVFRLCEASTCSYYNKWGCSYGYGQYILPLDTYLKIMAEFYFDDFSRYCTVCDDCSRFQDDDGDDTYECVLDEQYQAAAQQASASSSGDDYLQMDDVDGSSSSSNGDDTDDASQSSESNSDSSGSSSSTAVGYNKYNSWYFQSSSSSSSSNSNSYSSSSNNNNGYYNYRNYGYYAKNNGDNGNRRKLGNNNKSSSSSNSTCPDGYNRQKKEYPWYITSNGKCAFSTVCNGYKKACTSHQTNASDYEEFFSCNAFNVGGTNRYIGPHCRSDGHTIGIGIYADDQCSTYVGDTEEISEYTGLAFDDSILQNYYEKSCITCDYGQSFVLVNDSDIGSEMNVNPMCEALFDVSAKCNKYISGANNEDDDADDMCSFIETTSRTRYDEMGDIMSSSFSRADVTTNVQMYWSSLKNATIIQWCFVIITVITTLLLMGYSCYLQKKLLFRKPWVPPVKVAAGATKRPSISNNTEAPPRNVGTFNAGYSENDLRQEAAWFSRVNSGIVLTRTDSYGGSIGPLGLLAATAGAGTAVDAPPSIITKKNNKNSHDAAAAGPVTPYVPYGGAIPDRPPVSPGKQPPGRHARSVASRKSTSTSSKSEAPKGYLAFKGTFS